MAVEKSDRILIVGAGCFGISTAYHLLQRGYTSITVVDRSDVLPAPDAASTDLNKIVRSSYNDIFYAKLAQDAIKAFKAEKDVWGEDTYHETGVLVFGLGTPYADAALASDTALGARLEPLIADRYANTPLNGRAVAAGAKGYLNLDGGWAAAAHGVSSAIRKVIAMGGTVVPGKVVRQLIRTPEGRTAGVECADGTRFDADLVILASGAWTASAFPELRLGDMLVATGQSIATIQLSAAEAARYRESPVLLDFATGFYMFPPNEDNIIKIAIHSFGYTNTASEQAVSTPRTLLSHAQDGLRIPLEMLKTLRAALREVYPELADRAMGTRLCWYTDTPNGNWVIGPVSAADPGLILATGGSGHAFKFLPVIGSLVADAVEGNVNERFSIGERERIPEGSRYGDGTPKELQADALCSDEDLKGA
ncbi:hypothetical protein PLICRDRAFT_150559 [Plicaturopsis crispa FD-325 SS-3]|nr:hypothetical protein PLICRDRAFT_150559 [Plicaturopsis crispa FD-325 SS-3]